MGELLLTLLGTHLCGLRQSLIPYQTAESAGCSLVVDQGEGCLCLTCGIGARRLAGQGDGAVIDVVNIAFLFLGTRHGIIVDGLFALRKVSYCKKRYHCHKKQCHDCDNFLIILHTRFSFAALCASLRKLRSL